MSLALRSSARAAEPKMNATRIRSRNGANAARSN